MAAVKIQVMLLDGTDSGMMKMSIPDSEITATIFPRSLLNVYLKKKKPEFAVYLIYGKDKQDETNLYIGQGDSFARLYQHDKKVEKVWGNAIVFSSSDDYINKSKAEYIEGFLIKKAKESKRVNISNKTKVGSSYNLYISEFDEPERYITEMFLILNVMGIDFFTPSTSIDEKSIQNAYQLIGKDYNASMIVENSKYVLLKNSTIRIEEKSSILPKAKRNREKYKNDGLIVENNNKSSMIVTENIEFDTPSAAANFVTGSNMDGQTSWKMNGKTLKEIEQESINNAK